MKFTDILMRESLVSTKMKDFKLKKSNIDDSHIQKTIQIYAKSKNITKKEADDIFIKKLNEQIKNLGETKINKNAIENAPESVAFQLLEELDNSTIDLSEYGIENTRELLNRSIFFELTKCVLGENAQFFPLKNPFETKSVKPYFFIAPDHIPMIKDDRLKKAAKDCTTAFCTPMAEMVFSRKFSEKLAISALINGVKPKSKKYASYGGPIPDYYSYLEFVILHELLHFSAGDHFYTKSMVEKISKKYPKVSGRAHTILNYVGDFINNWQLAKSGYSQLPIGLFSENVNYDQYNTYEEMIDVVVEELMDLSDDDFDKMKDQMQKGMDEHMDNPDDKPSPGGQDSKPSDSKDSDSKGGQDSKPSDSKDSDSKGGQDSKDTEKADKISKAIDDAMKKSHQNIEKREDGNNDAESALETKEDDKQKNEIDKKIGQAGMKIKFQETTTVVNWKKLIKKMIPSGDGEVEDTYAKMSRQATSSMVTAQQTGFARVSPGEVMIDSTKRGLVFVIDNSGSCSSIVNQFNQEIIQLLKKNKEFLDNMFILKFSKDFNVNKIDVKKLKYKEIKPESMGVNDPKDFFSKGPKNKNLPEKPIIELFNKTFGSTTIYTIEMHKIIEFLHSQNLNIVMFTDDDLVNDKIFNKFIKLGIKRKNSTALFITGDIPYQNMIKKFGNYKWISILK